MSNYFDYLNYDLINVIVNFLYPDELDLFMQSRNYIYNKLYENRYKKIFYEQFLGFYKIFNDFDKHNPNNLTWRESYNFMNFSIPTIIIQNLDIKDFLNKHRKFLTSDQLSDITLSLNLPRILYETMFYKEYKEYYIQLYEVFPKLDWGIIYTFYKFINL